MVCMCGEMVYGDFQMVFDEKKESGIINCKLTTFD